MKKILTSMMLIAFVAVFISCNKSEQPLESNDNDEWNQEESTNYYIPSVDELVTFSEATMEHDAEMMPDGDKGQMGPKGPMHKGDKHGDKKRGHHKGFSLFKIFRSMDFTRDQYGEIRGFMREFFECMREVMAGTHDARKEIIRQAREERRLIIQTYRESERTPEDREIAHAALRELNQRIREQMRELMDTDAICICIQNLLNSIEGILTDDQKEAWAEYIGSLEGPCFSDDDD